ncbi:hypothetical protein [Candidatus Nitrosotenuis aquarius]|uniref:hypothetical protein n=1 Tax=Candidatus Nitrosotenuis aquarius TaxID=1846278 RepID=UPI0013C2C0F4|nr:hypothetical protein [Candidatus Nitrosotenuis aquarius]
MFTRNSNVLYGVLESKGNCISLCDILKNNTTKVIKKLESQIPPNIQTSSNLYMQYLHLLDDYFGTCYLWQKQYFDKLGFDKNMLEAIDNYWNVVTDLYCSQIEVVTGTQKSSADVQEKMMHLCDQYLHQALDYYGKIFADALAKMNQK